MKVIVKRLFNDKGRETGAILNVNLSGIPLGKIKDFVPLLTQFAQDTLYKGIGLTIYSSNDFSIIAIKNIDELSEEIINIDHS
jgi:hypothetical protein